MLMVTYEGEQERPARWWEYPILLPVLLGWVAVLVAATTAVAATRPLQVAWMWMRSKAAQRRLAKHKTEAQ